MMFDTFLPQLLLGILIIIQIIENKEVAPHVKVMRDAYFISINHTKVTQVSTEFNYGTFINHFVCAQLNTIY